MGEPLDTLYELGYWFATNERAGPEALRTELALREFQTYAQFETVAQVDNPAASFYAATLKSVVLPPDHRFRNEPVTGHLSEQTKNLLAIWKTQKYRCPVVVECWKSTRATLSKPFRRWWRRVDTKPPVKGAENVWLWDDAKFGDMNASAKGRRFYVRDFSQRYDDNKEYKRLRDADGRVLLGDQYLCTADGQEPGDGPRADLAGFAVDVPLAPEALMGQTYEACSEEQKITYRVVRAVAEPECQGFCDTINAWDKALLSLGPCHWTLGATGEGELEAFLAYLAHRGADVLASIVGGSGVGAHGTWGTAAVQNSAQRKYVTRLSQRVWQNNAPQPVAADPNRLNFFRSWHWFYRFQVATRLNGKVQEAMWDMARMRIRDILAAPAGLDIKNEAGKPATLGDVFRSEQTVMFLLEWHVHLPGSVFASGAPTERLANAIRTSGVDLKKSTDKWGDQDEERLRDALKKQAGTSISRRFVTAYNCLDLKQRPHPADQQLSPSVKRGSFKLYASDIGSSPF